MINRIGRLLRGRRILLPAMIYVQAITLVRNTLVARMLGPEQFGLAITFLLVQQFIESTTDTGLNKYLLQSRSGNRPSVQSTVQFIALVRGSLLALLIVALAYPLLSIFDLGKSIIPLVILAGASLFMGLLHYDNTRQQRNDIFINDSVSSMVGDTCGLIACIVALQFTNSYLVVLYGILARSAAVMVMSHIMAQRPYRLHYSRPVARSVFNFAWPLLINGPLLFFSTQADRLLVTALLGLRELGIYSATLLLLYLPLGLLTRLLGSIFVPRLSAGFHAGNMEDDEMSFIGIIITTFMLASIGFAAAGPLILYILYGPAYVLPALPVALIALAQATRFARTWPSSVALSVGRTGNLLTSNVIRLVALPLGMAGVSTIGGITGLAGGLLIGELIALLLSVVLLNRSRGLPLTRGMTIVGVIAGIAIGLPIALWALQPGLALAFALAACFLLAGLAALHMIDPRLLPRNLKAFGW